MTKAAVYLRISRDLKGDGLAIDRQREACLRIIGQREWESVAEYADESISAYAKNTRRPGYDRMVQDFQAGKFSAIVCYDLDRLTRQPRQLEDWIDAAEDKGLQLVTANGEADLSTDGGRMYARIKASVARAESERKGARQKAAAEQRARLGKAPLGVRLTGYTSGGEVVREEAETVRTIYAMFLRGESLRGITRHLVEAGHRTRHGRDWSPTSVTNILRNPRYAGHGKYYGEILEGAGTWEPLVTAAEHAAVQARLDDPARKTYRAGTDRRYLGSGLFLCGVCGETVASFTGGRYRCRGAHFYRRMGPIDANVRERVAARLDAQHVRLAPATGSAELELLSRRESAARARLARFQSDYEDGLIDGRFLRTVTVRAEQELEDVARERARITYGAAGASMLAGFRPGQRFLQLGLMEQRTVLGILVDVIVHPAPRGWKTFDPGSVELRWR